MIKIIFLGTNGWYDTETGNTVCTFIEMVNSFGSTLKTKNHQIIS